MKKTIFDFFLVSILFKIEQFLSVRNQSREGMGSVPDRGKLRRYILIILSLNMLESNLKIFLNFYLFERKKENARKRERNVRRLHTECGT